jgi:hypothetical protein
MLRLRLFVFEVYIDCPLLSTTSGREKFNNSTETEHLPGLGEGVFQALGTHLTIPDSRGVPCRSFFLLRLFQSSAESFAGEGCIGVRGRPPRKSLANNRNTIARASTVNSLKSKTMLICSMLQITTFQSAQ